MTLANAELEKEYSVKAIQSDDSEFVKYLFSLGCYTGETVTVISRKKNNLVLSIKDARYNVDMDLAKSIMV